MTNILSIDVEEYFCAKNLQAFTPQGSWDSLESRVEKQTMLLLDLFDQQRVEATFFILGWVAERLPDLVREIDRRGHEIATHGYEHRALTGMDPRSFETDLRRALAVTQPLVNQPILGFRAPSFTITPATSWAFDVLTRCGIRYDSSVFPIDFHPDYGFPGAPLSHYRVTENLTEIPISCVDIAGKRLPCSGGGYFRLLPYAITRFLFRKCIAAGRSVVFYLHPWEIDAEQPRYPLPLLKRWRHYSNIGKTEQRLKRLLDDFPFTSIRKTLSL
jgi:polysaccharide deacetylase family protein (PEP-CTERM system associated)